MREYLDDLEEHGLVLAGLIAAAIGEHWELVRTMWGVGR